MDHAHLPSGWRMRGYQEGFVSNFLFKWRQGCSLSFLPAFGSGGGGSSGSPPAGTVEATACHASLSPSGQRAQGWALFFSLFPGKTLYKDWGRCEECLFHACLCYACIPSAVLGPPDPSRVSLLGTGREGRCAQNPVLSVFQGNVSICQILVPRSVPKGEQRDFRQLRRSPSSCRAPGKGASGLIGTVKMPGQRAGVCVGMSEQVLETHLQVPKRAGWPGRGVGPDSGLRAQRSGPGHPAPVLSRCLLARGGWSISTTSIAKLGKGQGMEEDDLDPKLPSQAFGTGRACVSVPCVCMSAFVCVSVVQDCVLRAPVPQLSAQAASLPRACLLGKRRCVRFHRRERPRLHRSGIWCPGKRRGPWGEESFLCQIPKCHLGPCVRHHHLPARAEASLNCLGFGGQRLRTLLGFPAGVLG